MGEPIAESRVVGEPIVACGNGFQFPSLYRQKRFSVSCEVGREGRKRFSVSVVVQTEMRDYYYFYHRSDLREIIRFLREIECIEFECNEFVLVLFKIDLIHFEHSIIISSI